MNKDSVLTLIYGCIDRLNEQLPAENRLSNRPETVLLGDGSLLDSLSLISLVVEIEEAIQSKLDARVEILEAGVMNEKGPAFSTVGELSDWVLNQTQRVME